MKFSDYRDKRSVIQTEIDKIDAEIKRLTPEHEKLGDLNRLIFRRYDLGVAIEGIRVFVDVQPRWQRRGGEPLEFELRLCDGVHGHIGGLHWYELMPEEGFRRLTLARNVVNQYIVGAIDELPQRTDWLLK